MGERKAKISGKKAKGNNSSGRSLTLDFGDRATPKSDRVLKKQKPKPKQKREVDWENRPLSKRQEDFCRIYVETNNGERAAIEAGYSERSAAMIASENIRKPNVARRIKQLRDKIAAPNIATGAEVLEFYTKAMRGEIKDQFGLDMSAGDRIKAASELAKRTVDLDNKMAGKADAVVQIKLDWNRENSGE